MTSATLDEHIAMLHAANLKPDEAAEFARDITASPDDERFFRSNQTCKRYGFVASTMNDAERYTVGAAALVIAAEDAALTPFDRWLRKTYQRAEINAFSKETLMLMWKAYEAGTHGNR